MLSGQRSCHLRRRLRPARQPFSAPAPIPSTKTRCASRNSATAGTVISTDAATSRSLATSLRVVAVTSVAHSASVPSRHRGGRRLFEVADVVIDTHSPPGDACVTLPTGQRVGASSTVLGAAVVNAVVSRAAELVAATGADPGVITSMKLPDGTRPEQLLPG